MTSERSSESLRPANSEVPVITQPQPVVEKSADIDSGNAQPEVRAAEPPRAHSPQAPAALGGMGSTGPITVVPRKR